MARKAWVMPDGSVCRWVDETALAYGEPPQGAVVVGVPDDAVADFNPYSTAIPRCWHRDGLFLRTPPADIVEAQLEAARQIVWERIQARRDALINGGISLDGHRWHSDDTARARYVVQQYAAGDTDWRTLDGMGVMNADVAVRLLQTIAAHDAAVHAAAREHKAKMLLETDPSAYDYSQGWPA